MRNHHHNSQSIITALPLANDIQNDIYKIKKYKVLLGCSKDYVNTLKNQLISDTGNVYYALYRADDTKDKSEKIQCLDEAYTHTTILIQHLNQLAYNGNIDARKATYIANKLHELHHRITRWKKYILNKEKDIT